MRRYLALPICWVVVIAACSGPSDPEDSADDPSCEGPLCNRALLDALGFDPFYQKYLDASGIPVISSEKVEDVALFVAREIIEAMVVARPDVRQAMIANGARVGIMARTEVATDIPEHRHLANDPNVNWDTRARGLGGTPAVPITTGAEENLLCLTDDKFRGENILVHEFAHGIHLLGIDFMDPQFTTELRQVHDQAVAEGIWANTYAETNAQEYWAEGVQSWFDANQAPQVGIHNEIDTRARAAG